MLKKLTFYLITTLSLLLLGCTNHSREINNIYSFARVYGYVRWFYPSSESTQIDWNVFAIYGVQSVKNAKNQSELKKLLLDLFYPIAPSIQIFENSKQEAFSISRLIPEDTIDMIPIAWNHYGGTFPGTDTRTPYSSKRITPTVKMPQIGDYIKKEIGNKLFLIMPLTLYCKNGYTFPKTDPKKLQALIKEINSVKINTDGETDSNVRLANAIICWNVIQHFFPYFKELTINWNDELISLLQNTFASRSESENLNALRLSLAKLEDGHSSVNVSSNLISSFGLPVRYDLIENQIVVTYSQIPELKVGDIITHVDSGKAIDELKDQEKFVSGSSRLKRYIGLELLFGRDLKGENAKFTINRSGKVITQKIVRKSIKKLGRVEFSPFTYNNSFKLIDYGDSIYYLSGEDFNSDLISKEIVNARGIIINLGSVQMISHFINQTILGPKLYIPVCDFPDRENMYFDTLKQWTVTPK
jgi:hypothetical protein